MWLTLDAGDAVQRSCLWGDLEAYFRSSDGYGRGDEQRYRVVSSCWPLQFVDVLAGVLQVHLRRHEVSLL